MEPRWSWCTAADDDTAALPAGRRLHLELGGRREGGGGGGGGGGEKRVQGELSDKVLPEYGTGETVGKVLPEYTGDDTEDTVEGET